MIIIIVTMIIIMIIIINNAYISILLISPRGSRRAQISPEEDWNFAGKNSQKLGCFCITKKKLGEIFSRKKVQTSNFVKIKNPTMIQLDGMQLTSQTLNHVEITKTLSTSQCESRIIDCGYKIQFFSRFYKLTTYLVSLARSLPPQSPQTNDVVSPLTRRRTTSHRL